MIYAGGEHGAGERAHYWKSSIIFSSAINLKGNLKERKRKRRRYEPAMHAMTATLMNFFARGHCRGFSASRLLNFTNWRKLDTGLRTNVKGLQAIWKSYFSWFLLVLEERRLLRWEFVRGHVWRGFVDTWRGLESVECAGNG